MDMHMYMYMCVHACSFEPTKTHSYPRKIARGARERKGANVNIELMNRQRRNLARLSNAPIASRERADMRWDVYGRTIAYYSCILLQSQPNM